MQKKLHSPEVDTLFDAILSLKNRGECYQFFEDLCTVNELQSLAQRLDVAFQLTRGRTYMEISEATGASTATISRVNRSLNYGNDSYKMVLERINHPDHEDDQE
ncbi:MAG: YerC/YecD family TrpR-related protein [Lachnospiraceae bacterium]|jgi:TrpR-related protein YerC/YecD